MAHQLDTIANTDKAAFAFVGEKAWHGLGQQLDPSADRDTWLEQAGMDWEALSSPVYFHAPNNPNNPSNPNTESFPDKRVIYRSDTFAALSVVSDGYQMVQPAQILDFFLETGHLTGWDIETAGVLKGGRQFWALAKTGVGGKLAGDAGETDLYVMLATSLDGSMATVGQGTAVRVVCSNTLTAALSSSRHKAVKVSHRSTFDAKAMARALGAVDPEATWKAFGDRMRSLGQIPVTSNQATAVFSELLRPGSMGERTLTDHQAQDFASLLNAPRSLTGAPGIRQTDPTKGRAIRGLEALETSYLNAPGAMPGTAYGVLQGVTHYLDHVRGSDDGRQASAWFGQGARLKSKALDIIEGGAWLGTVVRYSCRIRGK